MTACTPGRTPGPTPSNEYGKPLPYTFLQLPVTTVHDTSCLWHKSCSYKVLKSISYLKYQTVSKWDVVKKAFKYQNKDRYLAFYLNTKYHFISAFVTTLLPPTVPEEKVCFYRPDVLLWPNQPTVSKHWRKHKTLTLTSGWPHLLLIHHQTPTKRASLHLFHLFINFPQGSSCSWQLLIPPPAYCYGNGPPWRMDKTFWRQSVWAGDFSTSQKRNFCLPNLHLAPLLGWFHRNFIDFFCIV